MTRVWPLTSRTTATKRRKVGLHPYDVVDPTATSPESTATRSARRPPPQPIWRRPDAHRRGHSPARRRAALGADDHLPKPFRFPRARCATRARPLQTYAHPAHPACGIVLDPLTGTVTCDGHTTTSPPRNAPRWKPPRAIPGDQRRDAPRAGMGRKRRPVHQHGEVTIARSDASSASPMPSASSRRRLPNHQRTLTDVPARTDDARRRAARSGGRDQWACCRARIALVSRRAKRAIASATKRRFRSSPEWSRIGRSDLPAGVLTSLHRNGVV